MQGSRFYYEHIFHSQLQTLRQPAISMFLIVFISYSKKLSFTVMVIIRAGVRYKPTIRHQYVV